MENKIKNIIENHDEYKEWAGDKYPDYAFGLRWTHEEVQEGDYLPESYNLIDADWEDFTEEELENNKLAGTSTIVINAIVFQSDPEKAINEALESVNKYSDNCLVLVGGENYGRIDDSDADETIITDAEVLVLL